MGKLCAIQLTSLQESYIGVETAESVIEKHTARSMFKNTLQVGLLPVLSSFGSKPLRSWKTNERNGHITRITDEDIKSLVLEVEGINIVTTYLACPADPMKSLGVKMPYLSMIVKKTRKYFSFEVDVLDDKNFRRRFIASTFRHETKVKPSICATPIVLNEGWNLILLNLVNFTYRAFGTKYVETISIKINANCRIRRVYFSDRVYSEDELPDDYKMAIFKPRLKQFANHQEMLTETF